MLPTSTRPAFLASDAVLLCLTTLHHRRFIEDAVHAVALPAGANLRLRYRKKYVAAGFWEKVSEKRSGSMDVLIALAVTSIDLQSRVEPIRRGTLINASVRGSIVVLDICLDDFVYEPGALGEFWKETRLVARDAPEVFRPNTSGAYLQQLVRAPQSLLRSPSIEAWEKVTSAFFRIDSDAVGLPGHPSPVMPFLFHVSQKSARIKNCLRKNGSLDFEAGRIYKLEVHTIARPIPNAFRNALGEIFLDLAHNSAAFVSSRRVRVDSRRDVKTVLIATTPLFRQSSGHLSVRTNLFSRNPSTNDETSSNLFSSAKNREEMVVARYDFPLRVGRVVPWLASTFVALAAAVAAFKMPADEKDVGITDLAIPICAFVLAFIGVSLGLKSDNKR